MNAKRMVSVFMVFLFCVLLTACANKEDLASKSQYPEFLPTARKRLKEVVSYQCSADGFYIVKGYFNWKGHLLEEHCYAIDEDIYTLDCKIAVYNTVDKKGNLIQSQGRYISNPYHAIRDTVLVMEVIEDETYDCRVLNEDGNVELYIKQTKNANGKVTREEYFSPNGRFLRSEEFDYRDNGTLSAYRGKNAKNELTYETQCDGKGNFLTCLQYEENGRPSMQFSAEYDEKGRIKTYKTTPVSKTGALSETSTVTEFHEDGRIMKHGGRDYIYTKEGKLREISGYQNEYIFDGAGYLLTHNVKKKGPYGVDIETKSTYKYDQYGRISSCVTENTKTLAKETVLYFYAEDGAMTVSHTNQDGVNDNTVYTDAKGRLIKSVVYNKAYGSSHQTLEYDVSGKITKVCDYDKGALTKERFYEYNEYGDLIKLETKDYYSSGSLLTSEEYEYFENGYVKNHISRRKGEITHTEEYDGDGGHIYTEYSASEKGKKYCEITYDKYGNEIKSVYFARAGQEYDDIVICEYYPDDSLKKSMRYYNDEFQSGQEYDENGRVIRTYGPDKNGAVE